MKIAIAIGGALLGLCAVAGAVCFSQYAKNTEDPSIEGFCDAVKKFCGKQAKTPAESVDLEF